MGVLSSSYSFSACDLSTFSLDSDFLAAVFRLAVLLPFSAVLGDLALFEVDFTVLYFDVFGSVVLTFSAAFDSSVLLYSTAPTFCSSLGCYSVFDPVLVTGEPAWSVNFTCFSEPAWIVLVLLSTGLMSELACSWFIALFSF